MMRFRFIFYVEDKSTFDLVVNERGRHGFHITSNYADSYNVLSVYPFICSMRGITSVRLFFSILVCSLSIFNNFILYCLEFML